MSAGREPSFPGKPAPSAAPSSRGSARSNDRRRTDEERRRASRVAATFAVSEATDGSDVHLCQAEDIAVGGMTIKHARGLSHELRTEVALRFALPGSREEIIARGEIVSDGRVGHFRRTGVRFVSVRPEHQQLIAAYCRRR
jgi:c-di-GMP-binding flagellar brake protein YcgR